MPALSLRRATGPLGHLLPRHVVPNRKLSKSKRKVIELDYGMTDGEVEMHCRQAVLYYLLQRLGLNFDSGIKPEAQQIALKNLEEVRRFLSPPTFS